MGFLGPGRGRGRGLRGRGALWGEGVSLVGWDGMGWDGMGWDGIGGRGGVGRGEGGDEGIPLDLLVGGMLGDGTFKNGL